jgi:hypothetical protein
MRGSSNSAGRELRGVFDAAIIECLALTLGFLNLLQKRSMRET